MGKHRKKKRRQYLKKRIAKIKLMSAKEPEHFADQEIQDHDLELQDKEMQEPTRKSNKELDKLKHPFQNVPIEHRPRGDITLETDHLYISMLYYFRTKKILKHLQKDPLSENYPS